MILNQNPHLVPKPRSCEGRKRTQPLETTYRTYTLQSNRANFNQYNVSPICQLCNKDPETREHFTTCCETLQNIRSVYLSKIRSLFEPSSDKINSLLDDTARCTQLLLDSSHLDITSTKFYPD